MCGGVPKRPGSDVSPPPAWIFSFNISKTTLSACIIYQYIKVGPGTPNLIRFNQYSNGRPLFSLTETSLSPIAS